MLDTQEGDARAAMWLSEMNFGALPMVNHLSRLAARFYQDAAQIETVHKQVGHVLQVQEAVELGLVTAAPDDLDWKDEVRQAIESSIALSPDG